MPVLVTCVLLSSLSNQTLDSVGESAAPKIADSLPATAKMEDEESKQATKIEVSKEMLKQVTPLLSEEVGPISRLPSDYLIGVTFWYQNYPGRSRKA